MKKIKKYQKFLLGENLKHHVENNISVVDNLFRPYSDSYFELLKESRECYENGMRFNQNDDQLFAETDLGKFEMFENKLVPLDLPIEDETLNEAEYHGHSVELNKPQRSSGPKKYKVYVKDPKTGNVRVVNFGDVKGGLSAKVSDPKHRASFAARHQCHLKKDKLTPGYWACRANRYANLWGGKTYPGYW